MSEPTEIPESVLADYRAQVLNEAADALQRIIDRINATVTDRKIAACQRVGLHMAKLKLIEMSDTPPPGS